MNDGGWNKSWLKRTETIARREKKTRKKRTEKKKKQREPQYPKILRATKKNWIARKSENRKNGMESKQKAMGAITFTKNAKWISRFHGNSVTCFGALHLPFGRTSFGSLIFPFWCAAHSHRTIPCDSRVGQNVLRNETNKTVAIVRHNENKSTNFQFQSLWFYFLFKHLSS